MFEFCVSKVRCELSLERASCVFEETLFMFLADLDLSLGLLYRRCKLFFLLKFDSFSLFKLNFLFIISLSVFESRAIRGGSTVFLETCNFRSLSFNSRSFNLLSNSAIRVFSLKIILSFSLKFASIESF